VCACVCVCKLMVCLHVCSEVCSYVNLYTGIHVRMYVCEQHIFSNKYMSTNTCMYGIYMHCTVLCVCACAFVYACLSCVWESECVDE